MKQAMETLGDSGNHAHCIRMQWLLAGLRHTRSTTRLLGVSACQRLQDDLERTLRYWDMDRVALPSAVSESKALVLDRLLLSSRPFGVLGFGTARPPSLRLCSFISRVEHLVQDRDLDGEPRKPRDATRNLKARGASSESPA